MSIDAAKSVGITPPFCRADSTPQRPVASRNIFSADLDKANNLLKNNNKKSIETLEQIKLSQLKMLQGLFSTDSDDDTDDLFAGLQALADFQRLSLQQSQIVDRYARQQYSLQDHTPQTKSEIDRLINRVAEKVSLSPELIHSVVSTESAYDPAAISHAGAQGLMQLMPETAAELGVTDSFDPEQNLLGGSQYLKQLLDKYDGDLDHALAAYNWGQGNVDRYGLKNLPAETRDYVARVKTTLEKHSS